MPATASARRMAQNEGNLGIVLRHLKDTQAARAAIERSLALYRSLPGDESAGIARDLETLGHLDPDPDHAIEWHGQALALRIKLYGDKPHPDVASSYVNLGSARCAAAPNDQALRDLDKALEMRLALRSPPVDDDLVGAYKALAACWARLAGMGREGAQARAAEYLRLANEESARGAPGYRP
jgi:tetratricopeptide (TPR) repeat protein